MKSLAHYAERIRTKGIVSALSGKYRHAVVALMLNNRLAARTIDGIGRAVELTGNTIKIRGSRFSVESPLISARHKGMIYLGLYENAELDLSARYLDRLLPTIEIGGAIGAVACATSRLLKNPAKHVVVEANPLLLPILTNNRDRNRRPFAIEHAAIGYNGETVAFSNGGDFVAGRIIIGGKNTVTVPCTTLTRLIDKYRFAQINLVCDCEGAEIDIVLHEPELLKARVRTIIMETHRNFRGNHAVEELLSRLSSLGFKQPEPPRNEVYAFINYTLSGGAQSDRTIII